MAASPSDLFLVAVLLAPILVWAIIVYSLCKTSASVTDEEIVARLNRERHRDDEDIRSGSH